MHNQPSGFDPRATFTIMYDRIFTADYTGTRYTYGLRNRPLSMGTAPKGYIIGSDGPPAGRSRWGTIQYPRQLTPDEIYDYELEIVLDTLPTNPKITSP